MMLKKGFATPFEKHYYRNCVITRPPPLKLISKVSDGFGRLSLSGSFSGQNMMGGFTL